MDKNTKIFIGVGGVILVLIVVLCFFVKPEEDSNELSSNPTEIMNNATSESNNIKEDEMKDFDDMEFDDYLELFESDDHDKEIVLIGRAGCHYCEMAEPILKKINKDYDLDIKYLGYDKLSDEDKEKLKTTDSVFTEGWGTPLLLIISDKKVVDKQNGLTDMAHYKELFKKNKFI